MCLTAAGFLKRTAPQPTGVKRFLWPSTVIESARCTCAPNAHMHLAHIADRMISKREEGVRLWGGGNALGRAPTPTLSA